MKQRETQCNQNEAACHPYYTVQQLWQLVSASKHLKFLVDVHSDYVHIRDYL